MNKFKTDRDWEKFGQSDPYYGVITRDKFRSGNLSDREKEKFFETGYQHVDHVVRNIKAHVDQDFSISRALDFGCGVGRLVIPLAEISTSVVGSDISASMLDEARKNCDARSIKNVDFVISDDESTSLEGLFDFIHSFNVFQHIPARRGEQIFESLLDHLSDGGVCVAHFTYGTDSFSKKIVQFIKRHIPMTGNLVNLIRGRDFSAPQMQMNSYNLNRIFQLVQKRGIREIHTSYTNHAGHLGIILYFRKP